MSTQPPTPTHSQPPEPPKIDQAKIEYDSLISYFKLLVWITGALFGLVVAAAGILLFKSSADIQNQLSATRDAATQQIAAIKTSAQDTAKSEAQKAIAEAFEKQNVQHMIETAAQKKVDTAVDEAIRKNLGAKIDGFRTFVKRAGEVSSHAAELRLDSRAGLDALLHDTNDPDPDIRAYSRSNLSAIAAEFESRVWTPNPAFFHFDRSTVPEIMSQLLRSPSADVVAKSFADMKKKVGWDVPMFQVPAAEKWCAEHKPTCEH